MAHPLQPSDNGMIEAVQVATRLLNHECLDERRRCGIICSVACELLSRWPSLDALPTTEVRAVTSSVPWLIAGIAAQHHRTTRSAVFKRRK